MAPVTTASASLNLAWHGSAMRCGHYKEFASAYLDGQLTWREAVKYGQHREGCATCSTYLAELRQLSLMLKSIPPPEFPSQPRRGVIAMIAVE